VPLPDIEGDFSFSLRKKPGARGGKGEVLALVEPSSTYRKKGTGRKRLQKGDDLGETSKRKKGRSSNCRKRK